MNKKQYEALYEEYKEIDNEISYAFQPHAVVLGQPLDVRVAPAAERILRHKELAKLLARDGKDFLKLDPGEWYEININAQDYD